MCAFVSDLYRLETRNKQECRAPLAPEADLNVPIGLGVTVEAAIVVDGPAPRASSSPLDVAGERGAVRRGRDRDRHRTRCARGGPVSAPGQTRTRCSSSAGWYSGSAHGGNSPSLTSYAITEASSPRRTFRSAGDSPIEASSNAAVRVPVLVSFLCNHLRQKYIHRRNRQHGTEVGRS
jgi:hypothetical protein